ncbi:hypothetical protein CACET_c23200 [Clostridium aceticum]|uniref:Uncharacterized protein n=1 Tax=Clostridium aceticum TaxID=84022 RepID=A0A0D8I5V8_9CLOT|nr:hypothetical protein [Clostridium aceticum]AKL95766.1 hypothetical protein CACET_c23200 [Clostridium aceticum]KJF25685.1 hypothetical protein TZ02_17465 [Clostridium aceticum]
MNHVIAKLRLRKGSESSKLKKVLSNVTLYTLPNDLANNIVYDPGTILDEGEWFSISEFSQKPFFLQFLADYTDSVAYEQLEVNQISNIDYICTCENANVFYFQRITKTQLLEKKVITIGDQFRYNANSKNIVVNDTADAIYVKEDDTLYFKKLSAITGIFKGIDQLFREATTAETETFLAKDFIRLENNFSANDVKQANRKRIALAMATLNNFDDEQKNTVFDTVKEYCPQLVADDNTFKIETENDLTLLLYGIDQRFYTTPDGKEKRIANSVIRLGAAV